MVWFGWMSDNSQLARKVGGGDGGVTNSNSPHITALPGSERRAGRGVAFPPLDRATLEGQSTAASGPARPCHRLWGSGCSCKSIFFDTFFLQWKENCSLWRSSNLTRKWLSLSRRRASLPLPPPPPPNPSLPFFRDRHRDRKHAFLAALLTAAAPH